MASHCSIQEPSKPTALEMLSLLDSYQDVHNAAGRRWKDALWSLTKARHGQSGLLSPSSILCATDLREEIYPRGMVIESRESTGGNESPEQDPLWEWIDPIQWIERAAVSLEQDEPLLAPEESPSQQPSEAECAEIQVPVNDPKYDEANLGLRRRRPAASMELSESNMADWIIETISLPSTSPQHEAPALQEVPQRDSMTKKKINVEEQDERLQRTDPINLFGGGLNARTLKVAQQEARMALKGYIAAATLARAVQQRVSHG